MIGWGLAWTGMIMAGSLRNALVQHASIGASTAIFTAASVSCPPIH